MTPEEKGWSGPSEGLLRALRLGGCRIAPLRGGLARLTAAGVLRCFWLRPGGAANDRL